MEIEKLHPWSERMSGARMALRLFWERHLQNVKLPKDENIYLKAEYDLIMSDLGNTDKWLQGYYIGYRNPQRDKKGKLVAVEAYFIDLNAARNIEREGLSLCGLKVAECCKPVPRTPQF